MRLKVRNGYQKSKTLFAANSRAHTVKLVLLPSKVEAIIELKDVRNWQEANVAQPAGAFEGVELHLLSVYPGSKYDDLCLSDVQMFVTATTPENPAYEKQRFAKIQTWKKERFAAAKLFQTTLGKALPVAAAYSSVPEQHPVNPPVAVQNECKDEACHVAFTLKTAIAHARNKEGKNTTPPGLATALSLASAGFNGMQPVRLSSRDKRALPRVDGLCSFQLNECLEDPCYESLPVPSQLGFLNAQSLLVVEQTGLPSVKEVLSLAPAACHRKQPSTFAWVTRDPPSPDGRPGIVKAVLLIVCGMVEGREETYPKASSQLLVYDGNGALAVLASENYAAVFTWDGSGATPKLARGQVTRNADEPAWTVQAATLVAGP